MKVALYGNICNNFYGLAKCLRQNNIADAHLYLNNKVDIQNKPESDDPILLNNYPEWIHMDNKWDPMHLLKRMDMSLVNELNKYDIVMLCDNGVMLAPFIKSKTIFYVTGGDLTRMPFVKRYMTELKGIKFWFIRLYLSKMQARGIRHIDKIITQPFMPFVSALEKLKIDKKRISPNYYPILIDTDKIKYSINATNEISEKNRSQLSRFNFIIFHPSRIYISKTKNYVDMGVWKGNDNLFKGFALFIKKYNISDACLAMPERIHSGELDLAKKIINDLEINQSVIWLKPPGQEGFPRNEMIDYYSISDIIADEFATGWFGSIVVEGAACSKPVFCYVDEKVMADLYKWHPIISVRRPEDICEQLAYYYFNKEMALKKGLMSRKWAEEYHSLQAGAKIYSQNLSQDLNEIENKN